MLFYSALLDQSKISPPNNIHLTAINSTSLLLQWESPIHGVINGYKYYCTEYLKDIVLVNDTVNVTSVAITGHIIKPYTNYTCYVSAVTAVGYSPYGNATATTHEDSKLQYSLIC